MKQRSFFAALLIACLSLLQEANAQYGNTKYGLNALSNNTTGSGNSAYGEGALLFNTTGNYNNGIGYEALFSNTTGNFNSATGVNALNHNTTGYANTASGFQSLYLNTTGANNSASGFEALLSNTSGANNTATGYASLFHNTTGNYNSAFGDSALYANTTGRGNTASGYLSLDSNTTGYYNSASGNQALFNNKTGYQNTASGYKALYKNTSGTNNTAVGNQAGAAFTYTNSTFVGSYATTSAGNLTNVTALGYGTVATASNQVRVGNSSVTSIGGQVGWSTLSDGRYKKNIKEDVPGLSFINKLRPITYNLDVEGIDKRSGSTEQASAEERSANAAASKEKHTGFVAQEVEKAANELKYEFGGVDKPKNEGDLYGLRYAEFVVPLVKAVQEQQQQIEKQRKQIEELKDMVSKLTGTNSTASAVNLSSAYLEQNTPNPFIGSTIIRYHVPLNAGSAKMVITDMRGSLIKLIGVNGNGTGQISLSGNALVAGTYTYTLYVDGAQIDSKQMIIAR